MLYPISNKYRSILNLNGIWKFKCVDDNYLPINPLKDYKLMAVPSSINDIVVSKEIKEWVERNWKLPQQGKEFKGVRGKAYE